MSAPGPPTPERLTVLYPDVPVFPLEQPLHICQFLHEVTEQELTHWPRRHVQALLRYRLSVPCACGCTWRLPYHCVFN